MTKDINFKRNPAILNNFLEYLLISKNYSIGTVKAYESDLSIFFSFIIRYKGFRIDLNKLSLFTILQISTTDITAFLVYLADSRINCSYTRKRKLAAIKKFFKWIIITNPNLITENPAKNIPYVESNLKLPKYLTLDQAKKIQSIFTLKNSRTPIRNNTIISLFLSTGIRVSELTGIKISDINFNNNSILIKGKGNRQRIVYFSNYCKLQLQKYIEIRNKDKKIIDTNALFISLQHKKLGINGVEEICEKAFKLIGLEKHHYTVHTLRHTAATIMYRYVTRDILLLKSFLGHKSITSTQIYTHIFDSHIKECVDKNPLNLNVA